MQVEYLLLDYERPIEAELALNKIHKHSKFNYRITYLANGNEENSYVFNFYQNGLIDKLIVLKEGGGAGLGARELFKNAECEFCLFFQIDQYCDADIGQEEMDFYCKHLVDNPNVYCIDLSGGQGRFEQAGSLRYSDRVHLLRREAFTGMKGIEKVIGGVGRHCGNLWSEEFIQNYIKDNHLKMELGRFIYKDNGKQSIRQYDISYGVDGVAPKTLHYTDEKTLFILSPFIEPLHKNPTLKLTDQEWREVISGNWPKEGRIPEADKPHSFKYWDKVLGVGDV